jgi:adenylate cyclase
MARVLSPTTVDRLAEARRNEDLVLAESSLIGERRVSIVRLVMFASFGISQHFVASGLGTADRTDVIKTTVLISYFLFAVGLALRLRTRKPDPRMAIAGPLIVTAIDFAFIAIVAHRDYLLFGRLFPEMGAAVLALFICFSVTRYSWIHVATSTALACATYVGLALTHGSFVPNSTPFVCSAFITLGVLIGLTNRSLRNLFSGLRKRDNLSRFLPRQIVDRVLAHGESSLRPTQCEVTVLFSDLRDFTALSEKLPPGEVLQLLDEYFGHMAQIVKGHDGVVNKFLGDGMLAFWGVPDRSERHAELALRAALDMRTKLDEINVARQRVGAVALRFGVGVHTGHVAAGMLGGADQHEYTIIGDAVNVASRIEGLTKTRGVDILVSERTLQLAGDRFKGERVAEEKVKGRVDPVVVYYLAPTPERSPP